MPIRLIIADDHALFRQGLVSLLKLQPQIEIVAEVARAEELHNIVATTRPEVLLLDLQMDRWVLEDIPSLIKDTAVIVLTASENTEHAMRAMHLGASAIVQKRFAIETLMTAIDAVTAGHMWMPPIIQAALASSHLRDAKMLSRRETEIVKCVASGLRNSEVAERLAIRESTVKTHLNNIFQKLGLRDRLELTRYAIQRGLVALTDPKREP